MSDGSINDALAVFAGGALFGLFVRLLIVMSLGMIGALRKFMGIAPERGE